MPTKIDVEPTDKKTAREAEPLTIIGTPQMKVDAMAKVSGETLYADDLALPRMLFCKILRSPHPHARIVNIDVTKAQAMPGVVATRGSGFILESFVSQDEHRSVSTKCASSAIRWPRSPPSTRRRRSVRSVSSTSRTKSCRR
jgi:hypothetical protein